MYEDPKLSRVFSLPIMTQAMRLSENDRGFGKRSVYKFGPQLLTLSVILSKLFELTVLWFSYL